VTTTKSTATTPVATDQIHTPNSAAPTSDANAPTTNDPTTNGSNERRNSPAAQTDFTPSASSTGTVAAREDGHLTGVSGTIALAYRNDIPDGYTDSLR
jgi:hypothetical protein